MNVGDTEPRAIPPALRPWNGATPSAWRAGHPLGAGWRHGTHALVLWCGGARPCSQGVQPISGTADRGPRYTLPAGDGSPDSCTRYLTRDARTVSPMPVAARIAALLLLLRVSTHPERAPHQLTGWSRGASHTSASAPNGARVLRGKPLRLCCSVLRALRVLRHGHAGLHSTVRKGTTRNFE